MPPPNTLRAIAVFEAGKGVLVLLVGCGLLALIHRDIQQLAQQLIRHLHLDPAKHIPQIFIAAAADMTNSRLWLLALFALAYALVRFVESYGLWHGKRWAKWFAAISGAIYIPFELIELSIDVTWLAMAALAVNVIIVGVILHNLTRQK